MKIHYLLLSLVFVVSCNNKEKTPTPVVTEPYPSLEKQRLSLASKPYTAPTRLLDSLQLMTDLAYLASDACEGRKPGTAGHDLAMNLVLNRMRDIGLDSFNHSVLQNFTGRAINGTIEGHNLIGWVKGTEHPEKFIVISAHYDHLGKANGVTWYGADDNASGTACLLAMAAYFKQHPHAYSLIFAALDREETGLEGAYAFVTQLPSTAGLANIKFNLNMDMVARSDNNEIFACGIFLYPSFAYVVNDVQNKTNVKLLMGHDGGSVGEDWTTQSDHLPFHEKRIPFIYIGVEDHPDYHQPTDTYDKVNYSSYLENANMILLMIKALKP